MEQEAETIRRLTQHIDEDFIACVEKILASTGRVVVTGIGKSALIAQKMVATFNSTGTPALYMHAADAIHGDLGMIQPRDVVMALSKSGETSEIKVLIPLLKRMNVPLIGMVSNRNSYLGTHADLILHAHAPQEADPLNLAPTSSTTAALAMGDALAICLLEARGFTHQDFARFHPGGALGKKLYLKVCDIFPSNPVPAVTPAAGLKEIILEITSKRLGATAVLNPDQSLAGIITDGDLRRMLNRYDGDSLLHLKASDIMTARPTVIAPDAYAVSALHLMQERAISQLLVIENDTLKGFIHLHDLIREGLV